MLASVKNDPTSFIFLVILRIFLKMRALNKMIDKPFVLYEPSLYMTVESAADAYYNLNRNKFYPITIRR